MPIDENDNIPPEQRPDDDPTGSSPAGSAGDPASGAMAGGGFDEQNDGDRSADADDVGQGDADAAPGNAGDEIPGDENTGDPPSFDPSPPPEGIPVPGGGLSVDAVSDEEYAATSFLPPNAPIAEYEVDEIDIEEVPRGRMGNMGFFDHLEELRWRIIKAVLALVGSAILCAVFLEQIMNYVILAPARDAGIKLINMQMMGQVTLAIQVSLYSGLIVSIPFILWQVWGFIKPGLFPKERKYASLIAVATIFCFLVGICFAYFLMIPTSVAFMKQVQFGPIENTFAIDSYFSFILGFILACGVVFEMPMLSFALARFGVVTAAMLRRYRRHAGVAILIVAAIITPTPDPFNQLMLAVPLYALYELSILVARLAMRQRAQHSDERE